MKTHPRITQSGETSHFVTYVSDKKCVLRAWRKEFHLDEAVLAGVRHPGTGVRLLGQIPGSTIY